MSLGDELVVVVAVVPVGDELVVVAVVPGGDELVVCWTLDP